MAMDGPSIRAEVRARTGAYGVQYDYVDASRSTAKPRKVARWSATDTRIRAYYAEMHRPLEPLAREIAALPGCRSVETLTDDAELRPQVVAMFREPTA